MFKGANISYLWIMLVCIFAWCFLPNLKIDFRAVYVTINIEHWTSLLRYSCENETQISIKSFFLLPPQKTDCFCSQKKNVETNTNGEKSQKYKDILKNSHVNTNVHKIQLLLLGFSLAKWRKPSTCFDYELSLVYISNGHWTLQKVSLTTKMFMKILWTNFKLLLIRNFLCFHRIWHYA